MGGADHYYLNYAVLHTPLNNSADIKYGPGEVKTGCSIYSFVQRFARWDKAAPVATLRDSFLSVDAHLICRDRVRGHTQITRT